MDISIAFLGIAAGTVSYIILKLRVFRYIEKSDPVLWRELGEPSWSQKSLIADSYIEKEKYLTHTDRRLVRQCEVVRLNLMAVLVLWIVVLVGTVLAFVF